MDSRNGPSLVKAAKSGSAAVISATAAQGLLGLLAQTLLALWLAPQDFGLFALTLSVSFVFTIAGAAGIQTMLTQLKPAAASELAPSAFRVALAASLGFGGLMALLSPVFAGVFGEDEIIPLLLVLAIGLPIRAYSLVAMPVLQLTMRFGLATGVSFASLFAQYGVSVALAALGVGAMSLVAGSLAGTCTLALILWAIHPVSVRSSENRNVDWSILRRAGWPLLGDMSVHASIKADYFALGLIAPTTVVGGYYFAYQLVAAAASLLYSTATTVLYPLLSRIGSDVPRRARGMLRAAGYLSVASSVGAALIILLMPYIETWLWSGKWADVVPAIALLASAIPGQVALTAPEQLIKASGHFRRWAAIHAVRAIGIVLVVIGVGIWKGSVSAVDIAGGVALFNAAIALGEPALLSRAASFPLRSYWAVTVPPWFATVSAAWAIALFTQPAYRLSLGIP